MIIEIIERKPELGFRLWKNLEKTDYTTVKPFVSETGECSMKRIKTLSPEDKDILSKFIIQALEYLLERDRS